MTIAQLKRHMDRRFDRLERTKADKADLAQFARKTDLRRFATKADLRRFATKKDLRRFAARRDLRRFATKKDARRWHADIKRYFKIVAEGLEEKIQKVADGVSQMAAVQLHISHHGSVLDEHETRITALERRP